MSTLVENVTCLGCGCACDDIAVRVEGQSVLETRNFCPLGEVWFRTGRGTASVIVDRQEASIEQAIAATATLLQSSRRPLVFVAPGLSCEEQQLCAAIADVLRARLDSATSLTVMPNVLASQERGFASSTFAEIRNRADLILYWAIDIRHRYPRFISRYAPNAATIVAVDVGEAIASVDARERFSIRPEDELVSLVGLRESMSDGIGALFNEKRYIALVYDAEPDEREARSPQRFDALVALAQSLNDGARCAAIALRGSGNSSGADSAFTAATGYPTAIDFARGQPRYRPHETHDHDVALVVGDWALPRYQYLADVAMIALGPSATSLPFGTTVVAIEAGAAGIHTAGTAVRADEVPLPLRPTLRASRSVNDVLAALLNAVR